MQEQLILVDEEDNEIGTAGKLVVHQQALRHRAFSVFVFHKRADQWLLLLQQRQLSKYHCGGLWTNSCCGHPRPGEATVAAAERRLNEEFGLQLALQDIGVFHYEAAFDNGLTENEVDHVLIGFYDDESISPHPDEIAAYRWVKFAELESEFACKEGDFTPWFWRAYQLAKGALASEF